jgi:hypothetical protein
MPGGLIKAKKLFSKSNFQRFQNDLFLHCAAAGDHVCRNGVTDVALLLQFVLGDTLAQGVAIQSLDKNDPIPVHYTLYVMDMATGKTCAVEASDEMDLVRLFVACIHSDEPESEARLLPEYVARLRSVLPSSFMP